MKADPQSVLRKLKIARGQLNGVIRMIEENAYCVDICTQLMASESLIKKANRQVLEAHIQGCVRDALTSGNGENPDPKQNDKVDEALSLLSRMLSL